MPRKLKYKPGDIVVIGREKYLVVSFETDHYDCIDLAKKFLGEFVYIDASDFDSPKVKVVANVYKLK